MAIEPIGTMTAMQVQTQIKVQPVDTQNSQNTDVISESSATPKLDDSTAMVAKIKAMQWNNANLLMMSSGNFDGIDFAALSDEIL